MRLLLDTHVVIWWLASLPRLGPAARSAIDNTASEVHVSAVTASEISIKKVVGKLRAPDDLQEQVERNGFHELLLSIEHGVAMADLPLHHKDPFDRMLIAQAQVEGLTLVTAGDVIRRYDVPVMPAGR